MDRLLYLGGISRVTPFDLLYEVDTTLMALMSYRGTWKRVSVSMLDFAGLPPNTRYMLNLLSVKIS